LSTTFPHGFAHSYPHYFGHFAGNSSQKPEVRGQLAKKLSHPKGARRASGSREILGTHVRRYVSTFGKCFLIDLASEPGFYALLRTAIEDWGFTGY